MLTTSSRCVCVLPVCCCRLLYCLNAPKLDIIDWSRYNSAACFLQIYRNFEIGKLIKLIMLDTRIIGRSPQNASLTAVNVRLPASRTSSGFVGTRSASGRQRARPPCVHALMMYSCLRNPGF
jgi:hypothetical protein